MGWSENPPTPSTEHKPAPGLSLAVGNPIWSALTAQLSIVLVLALWPRPTEPCCHFCHVTSSTSHLPLLHGLSLDTLWHTSYISDPTVCRASHACDKGLFAARGSSTITAFTWGWNGEDIFLPLSSLADKVWLPRVFVMLWDSLGVEVAGRLAVLYS